LTYRDVIEKKQKFEDEEIRNQMLYLFYVEGLDDIWEHNEWVVLPQTKK
jgi:hypothetical protein